MKYALLKNRVRINATGEYVHESSDPVRYADLRKKAVQALNRAELTECKKSLGLASYRTSTGKTYWE